MKKYNLYINGMETEEEVIDMIKDTIDDGDFEGAKDYLEQYKEFVKFREEMETQEGSPKIIEGNLDVDGGFFI